MRSGLLLGYSSRRHGHGAQPRGVEGHELELRLARVDAVALLHERDALVQRGQPRDAVPRVEEVGRAGEHPQ